MKIAVAQTTPARGDIATNLFQHRELINLAVLHAADAIFFGELSLTGYEPELAKSLATNQSSPMLAEFQEISDKSNIVIGVGVPTNSSPGIQISMIIFQPLKPRQIYSKQKLHADEFPYFVRGDKQVVLNVANKKIAPAICYETMQFDHADNACKLGAEIYLSSVAKDQQGLDRALSHYPEIARKYGMPVLMANLAGYCDNFLSVGGSAVWNKNGDMKAQLDDKNPGLLIFDTATETTFLKSIT